MEELGHKHKKIFVYCDTQYTSNITRDLTFHFEKNAQVFVREVVKEGSMDMQKIHVKDNLTNVKKKVHQS